MIEVTDMQKIGIGLTGFGVLFLFLGMLLFFDQGLLAIGNILFISGLALIIGLANTFAFFFQPTERKMKGTACFFGGMFILLMFSAVLGMLLELVGLYFLFSGFLPVVIGFSRRIPGLNAIYYFPFANKLADRLSGASKLPV